MISPTSIRLTTSIPPSPHSFHFSMFRFLNSDDYLHSILEYCKFLNFHLLNLIHSNFLHFLFPPFIFSLLPYAFTSSTEIICAAFTFLLIAIFCIVIFIFSILLILLSTRRKQTSFHHQKSAYHQCTSKSVF